MQGSKLLKCSLPRGSNLKNPGSCIHGYKFQLQRTITIRVLATLLAYGARPPQGQINRRGRSDCIVRRPARGPVLWSMIADKTGPTASTPPLAGLDTNSASHRSLLATGLIGSLSTSFPAQEVSDALLRQHQALSSIGLERLQRINLWRRLLDLIQFPWRSQCNVPRMRIRDEPRPASKGNLGVRPPSALTLLTAPPQVGYLHKSDTAPASFFSQRSPTRAGYDAVMAQSRSTGFGLRRLSADIRS